MQFKPWVFIWHFIFIFLNGASRPCSLKAWEEPTFDCLWKKKRVYVWALNPNGTLCRVHSLEFSVKIREHTTKCAMDVMCTRERHWNILSWVRNYFVTLIVFQIVVNKWEHKLCFWGFSWSFRLFGCFIWGKKNNNLLCLFYSFRRDLIVDRKLVIYTFAIKSLNEISEWKLYRIIMINLILCTSLFAFVF